MSDPILRQILRLSWPVLVAQVAHLSMAVTDTVVVGHYRTVDLAAIAIAASVHIVVSLTLASILQALSPVVAHLRGAGRENEIGSAARQGIWLALALGAAGFLLLRHPRWLVAWSAPSLEVEALAVAYLQATAWGLPAQLLYRTFYAFCAAVGHPWPVMVISATGALLHIPFSYALVHGLLLDEPLGAPGAGLSMAAVACFWAGCAAAYLSLSKALARFGVFAQWERPHWERIRELLRIGVPMGVSSMIQISAIALIALFVARLGAAVAAGHRVSINIIATCYMIPLSLAYSLTVVVGQYAGARDWQRARLAVVRGVQLISAAGALVAVSLALSWGALVAAYTTDPAVRAIAGLLGAYAAITHFFDAIQTAALFALRGYKVTLRPMLGGIVAFLGVGLAGGNWLAFHAPDPMGVVGFWLATAAGMVAATAIFGMMLRLVVRETLR